MSTIEAFTEHIFENTSIRKNPFVTIEKSSTVGGESGYGVFVDTRELEFDGKKAVELLRIPRKEVYCIKTVHEQLNTDEHDSEYNQKLKYHISQFMSNESYGPYINETNLLVVFFLVTMALSKNIEVPLNIRRYLDDVLLNTEVSVPVNKCQEDYDNWHNSMKEYLNFPQEKFLELLDDFCTRQFPELELSYLISKLYASVISRVLEIPEAVDENSEDFFVSSTLVPVLDFVNHNNDLKNAYYDIDRSNNDIVLLLEHSSSKKSERMEVFISYSPTEEVVHFMQVYGFIPKSEQAQLWCLRLDDEFLKKTNHRNINLFHFYLEMSIRPILQLVLYPDEVLVNNCTETFGLMLLPFAHDPKKPNEPFFEYDAINKSYSYSTGSKKNQVETSLIASQCVDDIFASDESEIYNDSRLEFGKLLSRYINYRLMKLNQLKSSSENSSFSNFVRKELQVLEVLLRQIQNKQEFTWYEKYGDSDKVLPVSELPPICPLDV